VSVGGVHSPPAHTLPPEQSLVAAQGQGPLVPPQVMHWLCQHSCEAPVHWLDDVQWVFVSAASAASALELSAASEPPSGFEVDPVSGVETMPTSGPPALASVSTGVGVGAF
jgi:hypothetical protein